MLIIGLINGPVFQSNYSGSCCLIIDNPVDPFDVVPHFGVDSREVWVCTADTPGYNALKVAIADKWTTGVTLWINRTH